MDGNYYYSILGWTITVAGAGVCYYYYKKPDARYRAFQGKSRRDGLPREAAVPADRDNGRKRRREERQRPAQSATASGSETQREQTNTPPPTYAEVAEKEDIAWAKELDKKRKGTNLAAPSRKSVQQKTVSQANAKKREAELSAVDSSNGGDADDDLSPAVSPALNGLSHAPSGKNVDDMLEPVAPGPSVLRLSESTQPKKDKPKQSRPAQQEETKKQRQNRKKAEEKKAQREADEKERRALEEKQRRAARVARGEPAKNGLGIASAPANNAWHASNAVAAAPMPAPNGQLLDTYNDTTSTESTAPTSNTSSPKQNDKSWWSKQDMPSEEEQERMLMENDENSWSTVPSKKNKRKNQNGGAVQPATT